MAAEYLRYGKFERFTINNAIGCRMSKYSRLILSRVICVNRKGRTYHEENSIDHRCYRRDRFSVYKVISEVIISFVAGIFQ